MTEDDERLELYNFDELDEHAILIAMRNPGTCSGWKDGTLRRREIYMRVTLLA